MNKRPTDSPGTAGVDYVIDIVDLQKSFQRRTRSRGGGYTTLKSAALSLFRGIRRSPSLEESSPKNEATHAIKDLTLRIPRGTSVGLIGRNGSGKSTFLKLVTGIYKPDSGKLTVHGRVAALIELGAGFHPDFTGRENLMLAGIMHGLTREEILARFDRIVEFAELAHVIDDPVRTYSSGMFMRLGFSIAIHTDPDILLVDEVLAVGDAGFVAKCKDRIAELRKESKTLVLVTHDLDAVERWCDEVIWLHAGEVRERGYPRRVIDAYRQFIEKGEEEAIFAQEHEVHPESVGGHVAPPVGSTALSSSSEISDGSKGETPSLRWGSREVEITSVDLLAHDGSSHRVFQTDDELTVRMNYRVHAPQKDLVFGIGINRADGLVVLGTNTDIERVQLPDVVEAGTVDFAVKRVGLLDGTFTIDVAAHRQDGYPFDYHKDVLHFTVRSHHNEVGVLSPPHQWCINGVVCRVTPSDPLVHHVAGTQPRTIEDLSCTE